MKEWTKEEINEVAESLTKKGFITISKREDGNYVFTLTQRGRDVAQGHTIYDEPYLRED